MPCVKMPKFQSGSDTISQESSDLSEFPEFLQGDQVRLKQILMSLIKHAFQNIRKDQNGLIQVISGFSPKASKLQVQILSTGRPISDSTAAQFNSQSSECTDVGISLVKHLVRLNEGKLCYTNNGADGGVFLFTMRMTRYRQNEY